MTNGTSPATNKAYKSFALTAIVFLAFCIDMIASFPGDAVTLLKSGVLAAIFLLFAYSVTMEGSKVIPSKPFLAVYLYLLLLFIRLFCDFVIKGTVFFMYQNPATLFIILFATILIPGLMLGFQNSKIDFDRLTLAIRIIFFLVLFLSVKDILTGRIQMLPDGRFSGYGVLDMIYMGHQGVSLILLSTYKFRKNIWFNIPCIVLGIAALGCSGSRGPITALIFCIFVYLFFRKITPAKAMVGLIVTIMLLVLSPLIIESLDSYFNSIGIPSFSRITKFLHGQSVYGDREDLIGIGFNAFIDHPFWGCSYLLPGINGYVHNIFLEQFMALGLLGGLLFLGIMGYTLVTGYRNWRLRNDRSAGIFFILFVQYLIFGCFSRTIIALPQLWVCTFIILHYDSYRYIRRLR